ncbi:MAG: DUF2889 domain-containing protein, partial [Alphaproteobacteria bacterium]|nr:DUF2889 domain-containing protein [Alphaproteobacteria bacterium]
HCMAVTLHHDGSTIIAIESLMDRAPWTTCPGARAVLGQTFIGVALREAVKAGDKVLNCTHLYDLVLLAAAHALDDAPTRYDILANDPVDGAKRAEIRRDDVVILAFELEGDMITAPAELAGRTLFQLRDWVAAQPALVREAARMLQWGTIMSYGRTMTTQGLRDVVDKPAVCYTFQLGQRTVTEYAGEIFDFSGEGRAPLAHFDGERFGPRMATPAQKGRL